MSVKKLTPIALALAFALTLGACGDDAPGNDDTPANPMPSITMPSATLGGGSEDNGRPFNSTDEAVIEAVLTATSADKAEFDGKTLNVTFNEGSIDDPVAAIKCSGATITLADDERAFLIFPDGKIDCANR